MGTYYPGLDIFLSFSYLFIIATEARAIRKNAKAAKALTSFYWQLPGFVLSITSLMGLETYSLFILQFWHTPVMPLLSFLTIPTSASKSLYYYCMLLMFLLLSLFYYALAKNENPLESSGIESRTADNNAETSSSGSRRNR